MSKRYGESLGWLVDRPITHRGLHDAARGIPENSIAAARAAIERGFAIECDVQISADGTPFIFHDHTLDRLTGAAGTFRDLSDDALRALRLRGSDEAIPTVAEFLEAVDGRVPVVMELKGTGPEVDTGYLRAVRPAIDGYGGKLALMSFDDWLIDQMLSDDLPLPVGLTAEGTAPEVLARHQAVFDRGCDFVSYNVHHLPNGFVARLREERQVPVISWTVRMPDDVARSASHVDQMTFEGFVPHP